MALATPAFAVAAALAIAGSPAHAAGWTTLDVGGEEVRPVPRRLFRRFEYKPMPLFKNTNLEE